MTHFIEIYDDSLPEWGRGMRLPAQVVSEIFANPIKAIDFARAVVGKYERGEKANEYYKIMDGHKFLLKIDEKNQAMKEILDNMLLIGEYEPYSTKLVKEIVKEGDVAVDIGASIGHFTMLLARQVGKTGKVYSIEPTNNQFPYLLENIKANGYEDRVEALQIAAWDKNEIVKPQVNAGHEGEIQGRVLDDLLPERVDFVKMDTDGAEPRVLKGLEKTIERNPQLQMVIEYYPKYVQNLGGRIEDVDEILDKYFIKEKIGDYGETYWNYYCKHR